MILFLFSNKCRVNLFALTRLSFEISPKTTEVTLSNCFVMGNPLRTRAANRCVEMTRTRVNPPTSMSKQCSPDTVRRRSQGHLRRKLHKMVTLERVPTRFHATAMSQLTFRWSKSPSWLTLEASIYSTTVTTSVTPTRRLTRCPTARF